ncbi:MAG: TRAP transporter small permease [Gammaproteobacteria bacterium]|nr:MAG: TRAP transporter small permease [Gammaproteobacteria bacterium]
MTSTKKSQQAERLLNRLARAERAITSTAFVVLVVVVFGDVASRELTGTGLHWARQAGVYANLFVVMFGLGVASAGGAHLRPRFADGWLPARFGPVLDRLQDAGMALFCVVFAGIAVAVVAESFELAERSVVLRVVIWPFQAVIPIAFTLAGLRHLAYAMFPELRPPLASAVAGDEEGGT